MQGEVKNSRLTTLKSHGSACKGVRKQRFFDMTSAGGVGETIATAGRNYYGMPHHFFVSYSVDLNFTYSARFLWNDDLLHIMVP